MIPVSTSQVVKFNLPVFGGFPYLTIKLTGCFYHLLLLPSSWSIDDLKSIARCQAQANDLSVCLALHLRGGIYFSPDGSESQPTFVHRGGIVSGSILRLPVDLPTTAELAKRKWLLEEYCEGHNPGGYAFGDLTKGGHDASLEEAKRLAGMQPNGVPNGLEQCNRCGDWRGICLDPSPQFKGKVMRVSCLCENNNICASCGQRLCDRKLDANYFDISDGHIWHVPGFMALKHRCMGGAQWKM